MGIVVFSQGVKVGWQIARYVAAGLFFGELADWQRQAFNFTLNMNRRFQLLFWFAIPVIIGIAAWHPNRALDIQMHDTYLVISAIHIGILWSAIFALIGFIYWVAIRLNMRLNYWLALIHFSLTFLFSLAFLIETVRPKERYNSQDFQASQEYFQWTQTLITLAILSFLLAQILLLINLIIGFSRQKLER